MGTWTGILTPVLDMMMPGVVNCTVVLLFTGAALLLFVKPVLIISGCVSGTFGVNNCWPDRMGICVGVPANRTK